MPRLITEFALLAGAVSNSMALYSAAVASTSECALYTWVSTVGLVVTHFAAVVAFASETATSRGFGAVASEVARLMTAIEDVRSDSSCSS